MKLPIVIGIHGKQGSGKTTTAQALLDSLINEKYKVKVIKFADALYEMHDAVNAIYNKYGVETPKKDGFLLQWIGTEHGRNTKGQNVWVDIAARRIMKEKEADFVIIDDLRFPNEFNKLYESDFNSKLFKLYAPKEVRKARCDGWRDNDTHLSETALDDETRWHAEFDTSVVSVNEVVENIKSFIKKQDN